MFVSTAHSAKMDADRLEHQQKILKIIENHAVTLDDIYSEEWTLSDEQDFENRRQMRGLSDEQDFDKD
jgi:hypothetical protein